MEQTDFSFKEFGEQLKTISESIQKLASELDEPQMEKRASSVNSGSIGSISALPGNKGSNPLLDFLMS